MSRWLRELSQLLEDLILQVANSLSGGSKQHWMTRNESWAANQWLLAAFWSLHWQQVAEQGHSAFAVPALGLLDQQLMMSKIGRRPLPLLLPSWQQLQVGRLRMCSVWDPSVLTTLVIWVFLAAPPPFVHC
jgi:hypothetical protein